MSAAGDRLFGGRSQSLTTYWVLYEESLPKTSGAWDSLPKTSGMSSVVVLSASSVSGPGNGGEKIKVYSLIAPTDFHPPLCERVVVRDGPSLL